MLKRENSGREDIKTIYVAQNGDQLNQLAEVKDLVIQWPHIKKKPLVFSAIGS